MDNERFEQLKAIVNLNYEGRHDLPQMYFSVLDLRWLIEQAEKLEKIKLLSNAEDLTVADFGLDVLRIIESREIPTRKPRI